MDEGKGTGLNPFLNHLIIEKVISYTNGLRELKSLRLTSSHWNSQATLKLLNSSVSTFKSKKDAEAYAKLFNFSVPHWNFHWKATGIDLTDKLMKNVLSSARELHISKGLITLTDLREILKFGTELRTLSFNEVFIEQKRTESADVIERVMELGFTVENLQRLEVTTCDKDDNFPWSLVFPALPNLRHLHAQLQSTSQVTKFLESMLEHQVKLDELSCFLVDFQQEHLELLACLEVPLKVLDISIASSVPSATVESLLSSVTCRSLETIKIFKETDCGHKNYFSLPKLPHLKSLELLGDPVAKIFNSVTLNCLKLESLNLSEVSCRDVMAQKSSHFNLKSLCIEECFFPSNVLVKLGQTFPSLSKLCLFLNDDNVGTVFEKFTNLQELTILGSEISDDGITGGRDSYFDIGETKTDDDDLAQNKTVLRPYIGDCKKLRMLSLYPQPLPGITDVTIYQGLLHVQELTSVSLPETAITDKGLRRLRRGKPHLVKLYAKVVIDVSSQESFIRSTKYQIL